jgi:hypothetical protein
MAFCAKHTFQDAIGKCRTCHGAFCDECLVFPRGPKRSALCIPCALAAAGISNKTGRQRALQRSR